ncbi:hypothetical protein HDU81_007389 [Chytriomyces hyalinus]|nr:hypothetical protein HDU81_007389 [Chytriomyces hyalinus]
MDTASLDSGSPFGDDSMLITAGGIIFGCIIAPLMNLNLDDNMIIQWVSILYILLVVLCWIIITLVVGPNAALVPTFGPQLTTSPTSVIGQVMFNFTLVNTVPSWINTKNRKVSIHKCIWFSTYLACAIYVLSGVFGGLGFEVPNGSNLLSAQSAYLSVYGPPALYGLANFITLTFPILVLTTSIPVAFIIIRLNLVMSRLCSKDWATFYGSILPFIICVPFQTGTFLTTFTNWSIMAQSVLDELENLDLDGNIKKKISDEDDDFDYVYHLPHADLSRLPPRKYDPFAQFAIIDPITQKKQLDMTAKKNLPEIATYGSQQSLTGKQNVKLLSLGAEAQPDPKGKRMRSRHHGSKGNLSADGSRIGSQHASTTMLGLGVPAIGISRRASNVGSLLQNSSFNINRASVAPSSQGTRRRSYDSRKVSPSNQDSQASVDFAHPDITQQTLMIDGMSYLGSSVIETDYMDEEDMGPSFKALPDWITKYVKAKTVAIICFTLITTLTLAIITFNFVMLGYGVDVLMTSKVVSPTQIRRERGDAAAANIVEEVSDVTSAEQGSDEFGIYLGPTAGMSNTSISSKYWMIGGYPDIERSLVQEQMKVVGSPPPLPLQTMPVETFKTLDTSNTDDATDISSLIEMSERVSAASFDHRDSLVHSKSAGGAWSARGSRNSRRSLSSDHPETVVESFRKVIRRSSLFSSEDGATISPRPSSSANRPDIAKSKQDAETCTAEKDLNRTIRKASELAVSSVPRSPKAIMSKRRTTLQSTPETMISRFQESLDTINTTQHPSMSAPEVPIQKDSRSMSMGSSKASDIGSHHTTHDALPPQNEELIRSLREQVVKAERLQIANNILQDECNHLRQLLLEERLARKLAEDKLAILTPPLCPMPQDKAQPSDTSAGKDINLRASSDSSKCSSITQVLACVVTSSMKPRHQHHPPESTSLSNTKRLSNSTGNLPASRRDSGETTPPATVAPDARPHAGLKDIEAAPSVRPRARNKTSSVTRPKSSFEYSGIYTGPEDDKRTSSDELSRAWMIGFQPALPSRESTGKEVHNEFKTPTPKLPKPKHSEPTQPSSNEGSYDGIYIGPKTGASSNTAPTEELANAWMIGLQPPQPPSTNQSIEPVPLQPRKFSFDAASDPKPHHAAGSTKTSTSSVYHIADTEGPPPSIPPGWNRIPPASIHSINRNDSLRGSGSTTANSIIGESKTRIPYYQYRNSPGSVEGSGLSLDRQDSHADIVGEEAGKSPCAITNFMHTHSPGSPSGWTNTITKVLKGKRGRAQTSVQQVESGASFGATSSRPMSMMATSSGHSTISGSATSLPDMEVKLAVLLLKEALSKAQADIAALQSQVNEQNSRVDGLERDLKLESEARVSLEKEVNANREQSQNSRMMPTKEIEREK